MKRTPLWVVAVLHWCEMMGNMLIITGGLWGFYTFSKILTRGYVCYNEASEGMAVWELCLSVICIAFGGWHAWRDGRAMWANRESKVQREIDEAVVEIGEMLEEMNPPYPISRLKEMIDRGKIAGTEYGWKDDDPEAGPEGGA